MLLRNKKTFSMGVIFGASFVIVLVLIFSPIFGNGMNGLQFSDDLFNKLSKGSSYFIPDTKKQLSSFDGRAFSASVKPSNVELATRMLIDSGLSVAKQDDKLKISGDLGKLLDASLTDADSMYHNKGAEVAARYGLSANAEKDSKAVLKTWWQVLGGMVKDFQFQKKIEEANAADLAMRKGVEPGYNFYGVPAESVTSKALLMISLLVFYVAYTMWWGYSVFYMFDGVGLSMKKAKVKKEV